MKREYNLNTKPETQKVNKDNKVITFCVCVIFGCIILTSLFCNYMSDFIQNMTSEQTNVNEDDFFLGDGFQGTSVSDVPLESTIASMSLAGNNVASMQNEMIVENDKYLSTIKNATSAGYYDTILMTDEYKNLLDSFDKQYMRERPKNAHSVMWSEYGVWEFNADYDYSAELNVGMPAVWVCYDKNDPDKRRPYAFVTATYIASSDKFVDARLFKTDWYPTRSKLYEYYGGDDTIVEDQCDDSNAANGSNDDGIMTREQLEIREELQRLIDIEKNRKNAIIISN